MIDDEDKSLGNKLALLDSNLESAIQLLNEKFGPGTVQQGTQGIPQPPIKTPQAIFEFEERMKGRMAEGGRIGFDNGSDLFIEELNKKLQKANLNRKTESIDFYIDKFGQETLNKIAQDKHGKNFFELEGDNLNNLKRRLIKYEDFVKQNNRMPTESEARKFGRTDRDKTIFKTGGEEVTDENIRNKIIEEGKPAEVYKNKIIFADKNIQNEFEAELKKRYSFPRTSAAAEAAGVLNNNQIYEKFLKPAGYKLESTRSIIDGYKKFLNLDYVELTADQKEAKKVEREKLEKISQGGRRISGTKENPVHHMFPLGDQIGARAGEFTIIPKKINSQIAYANKQMKKLILERGKLLDQVMIDTAFPKGLEKKLDDVNNKAEKVINNHYKKYPSHEGLLNWKKIDFVTDDVGRLLNVRQIGTIGGDYKKWTLANIDKTILDKKVANLSDEELRNFRQVIDETSVARDAGNKGFGAKEGTPIKNLFTSLKNKLDTSRMFTSRIPGGAIALAPADFILSMGAGMPLLESAASAGSYLIKDPYIGKAVNIPLAIAQDMQDPEAALQKGIERGQKAEDFLQGLVEGAKGGAGDQPDIDPFQAAKGGRAKLNKGGGVEITPLPRASFSNGGSGADVDFATQLEYFLTNEDAELPQLSTYKETKNPIEVFNDIIDPRNYPYYADVLARSGLRVGEFGLRILPATGKLIADAIQKGPFKIKETGNNYVQDYTDVLPSNIKGTGIFSEFLENITPTSLEKKIGLASLIEKEEQKQKDRGSTVGPKVFADTIGLGAEVTAPIFPGLKLLNSFAKARNLPNDKVTQKILEKEIDEVLDQRGMNRREFLQATGAGATVVLAKMLGLMDVAPKVAKVARAAPIMDNTVQGMPAWFKDAVYAIERKGLLKSRGDIKGIEPDFFEITLNTKLGKKKILMSKNDRNGEITLDWTTSYYDSDIPVTITYKPGEQGKQNFLSDPEFPQSVEKYDVEVEAPEFEYKTVDTSSAGADDVNFDSAVNLDIKEEADAVVEALEELGLGLTKRQKKDAAENFRYYNDVELDEGSGPDTMNPIDENDAFPFLDEVKRNK